MGWSYWDVYSMPVPFRKWFLKKCLEKQEKEADKTVTPLSEQEKVKAAQKSSMVSNKFVGTQPPRKT